MYDFAHYTILLYGLINFVYLNILLERSKSYVYSRYLHECLQVFFYCPSTALAFLGSFTEKHDLHVYEVQWLVGDDFLETVRIYSIIPLSLEIQVFHQGKKQRVSLCQKKKSTTTHQFLQKNISYFTITDSRQPVWRKRISPGLLRIFILHSSNNTNNYLDALFLILLCRK